MSVQLAKGPSFKVYGSQIGTKRSVESGSTTHLSHDVELSYSRTDDAVLIQGTEEQRGMRTERGKLHVKVGEDAGTLLLSSSDDFGTHVALGLAGFLGDAKSITEHSGSITSVRLERESGRLEVEHDAGPANEATEQALGKPAKVLASDVYERTTHNYRPGPGSTGTWFEQEFVANEELAQEWLIPGMDLRL